MCSRSGDKGRLRETFILTLFAITQEPQELQRYNCAYGFIHKSTVIKYHQLLSKVKCINRKLCFQSIN